MTGEKRQPYLATVVDFLERDDQTITRKMCYPVTRVELLSQVTPTNPNGLPKRVFVVENNRWVEQS